MGDYLGFTGFACRGKLTASYGFKAKYEHSIAGSPPCATLVEDRRLKEVLSKITSSLDWNGGIDLDGIETKDGQCVLLEITPRLSGTIIFPLKLGIDLPSLYLSARTGEINETVFVPKKSDAYGYIDLLREAYYIAKDPRTRRLEAQEFRDAHICLDSNFHDDRPLARAMNRRMMRIAISFWAMKTREWIARRSPIAEFRA